MEVAAPSPPLISDFPNEVSIQVLKYIVTPFRVCLKRTTPLGTPPMFEMHLDPMTFDGLLPLLQISAAWNAEISNQLRLHGTLFFVSSADIEPLANGGPKVVQYVTHGPFGLVELLRAVAENIRTFCRVEISGRFPGSSTRAMSRGFSRMPMLKSLHLTTHTIDSLCRMVSETSTELLHIADIVDKGLATFICNLRECWELDQERIIFDHRVLSWGWWLKPHQANALIDMIKGEMAVAKQGTRSRARSTRDGRMRRLELELRQVVPSWH